MNTKQEFLEKLKSSLIGTVDDGIIYDKISYYGNYIDGELKNGRNIKEILSELGDPALIAKTIKTVEKIESIDNYQSNDSYSGSMNDNTNDNTNNKRNNFYGTYMSEKSFINCFIICIVFFILFSIIWKMFCGTIKFAVSFLGVPGILLICILWVLFNKKR